MSIRYLPTTFAKILSPLENQVYSLLHPLPLILCLVCALWGIYHLDVTIRAEFNSWSICSLQRPIFDINVDNPLK